MPNVWTRVKSSTRKRSGSAHLPKDFHQNTNSSDFHHSSQRPHGRRPGSNYWEGKHLRKLPNGARTKTYKPNLCSVQPFQWPPQSSEKNTVRQIPPKNPPFKSIVAAQNSSTHHCRFKGRRSTQPCLISLTHFSKPNQPWETTGKARRSASISNPLRQDRCSLCKSSDFNCLAPTRLCFQTEISKFSCSTVSTDV